MASLNKVELIGNLGRDPELRYTGSGQAVVNFTLATHERWTGRDNTKQERTEWHRVVVWGNQGETCAKYLKKGRQVFVEGRIQTRQWQDKDGNARYTTEIVANRVLFLGGREDGAGGHDEAGAWVSEGGGGGGDGGASHDAGGYADAFGDDEIPF